MTGLEVRGLTKQWHGTAQPAVDRVALAIEAHEVVAIVGESGAGKSTLARMIVGCCEPTAGTILLDGHALSARRTLTDRHRIQLVGQNPRAALNRRRTVRHALEQAARLHDPSRSVRARRASVDAQVRELGLEPTQLDRRPHTLSGGELARVVFARALLCAPAVLVVDEPTASLDGPTKRQVVDLVRELARTRPLAVIVITHEIAVARRLADRTAVMLDGRFVEHGPTASVLGTPTHDYTKALLRSVLTVERALATTPG